MDLKRNVRVDQLIGRYDKIQKDIKKEQMKRKKFLNSDNFLPIVGPSDE